MTLFKNIGFALIFGIGLAAAVPMAVAKNVVLIIGNSDYRNVTRLENPVNDATLAVSTFSALGFQTFVVMDADSDQMHHALQNFRNQSSNADIAAILFFGHGIQAGNENYLVATDTQADSLEVFQESAIRLEEFLSAFSETSAARILMLDACRDNPFAQTRSLTSFIDPKTRGLSRINHQVDNLLVVYSAQPDHRALDGDGDNSPFMEAVSSVLTAKPSVQLSSALIDITNLVRTRTANKQLPYTEGSLSVHIELKLNFEAEEPEKEPDTCSGSIEEIPFAKSGDPSMNLSPMTRKLTVPIGGDVKLEVCLDKGELWVRGPFDARYTGEALRNLEDEGVGYYFETADRTPAHLWFYADGKNPGAPVEIGYYLNEEEIKWIETNWVLP